MRKMTSAIVVLLLLSTTHFTDSSEQLKVLVDESKAIDMTEIMETLIELAELFGLTVEPEPDWRYSFENTEGSYGFGTAGMKLQQIASLDIKKSGKINYNTLKNYDVLIVASFGEEYSAAEVAAIGKFVENGGGLLFLACNCSRNNSVSEHFDVSFPSGMVYIRGKDRGSTDNVYVTDIASHPVTEGVKQILLNDGVPITSYRSGEVLARTSSNSWADENIFDTDKDGEKGPFDILLAQTVGRGRTVFFGGSDSFQNYIVAERDQQNLTLFSNAVKWLGEPGGPYKQYKVINEKAQQALIHGKSLLETRQFSQAKRELDSAIRLFEESSEIYSNSEAVSGIAEAENYLKTCETGLKADTTFDKATELFGNREYEKAIEEYEKAKLLYQELEYAERVKECATKVEESNTLIALRDKATQLFSEAEEALIRAPSIFSTAGYEEARSLFEQSREMWEEYNDPAQVQVCQEQIRLCNDEIAAINKTRMIVIGVVIAAVAGVAALIVMRRRKPAEDLLEEGLRPDQDASEAADRYVRGEITKEEYEKTKSDVNNK